MKIEWVAPPSDLRALVHTFYSLELGETVVREPSPAFSAQLVVLQQGRAEFEFVDEQRAVSGPITLNAPQLEAGVLSMFGPIRAVGASLTPLGWAALIGKPVPDLHDCVVPPGQFASPEMVERVDSWRSVDAAELSEGLAILEVFLRNAPFPIKPKHRDFVEQMTAWLMSDLNPPIEGLYSRLPFSERQVQRLSRRFFGAPPTQVLMRHRAIRLAMLLSNEDLPRAYHDELKAAYFDQAHMIRSIRRFTGRTPANLTAANFARMTLNPDGHGETAEVLKAKAE